MSVALSGPWRGFGWDANLLHPLALSDKSAGREMAYVQVGANAFHVRRSGTGDSIVLLHGVGADIETWDGVVAALGDGFDVLSLDQRGHGRSDKPSGPLVLDNFVEDFTVS